MTTGARENVFGHIYVTLPTQDESHVWDAVTQAASLVGMGEEQWVVYEEADMWADGVKGVFVALPAHAARYPGRDHFWQLTQLAEMLGAEFLVVRSPLLGEKGQQAQALVWGVPTCVAWPPESTATPSERVRAATGQLNALAGPPAIAGAVEMRQPPAPESEAPPAVRAAAAAAKLTEMLGPPAKAGTGPYYASPDPFAAVPAPVVQHSVIVEGGSRYVRVEKPIAPPTLEELPPTVRAPSTPPPALEAGGSALPAGDCPHEAATRRLSAPQVGAALATPATFAAFVGNPVYVEPRALDLNIWSLAPGCEAPVLVDDCDAEPLSNADLEIVLPEDLTDPKPELGWSRRQRESRRRS